MLINSLKDLQSHCIKYCVIDNITSIIPGRSNLNNIGVQIDQNYY